MSGCTPKEPTIFPVIGKRCPLPSIDLIEDYANKPVSVHGTVSIQVYGLNRLALVQERTRILRKLEFLADIVVGMFAVADDLSEMKVDGPDVVLRNRAIDRTKSTAFRAIAEIKAMAEPHQPYSAMVAQWIAVFKKDLAKDSPAQAPPPVLAEQGRALNLDEVSA